jgi:hypothetical protein
MKKVEGVLNGFTRWGKNRPFAKFTQIFLGLFSLIRPKRFTITGWESPACAKSPHNLVPNHITIKLLTLLIL